jgi:hypothetical protein
MNTYFVNGFNAEEINGHWYVRFVESNHPEATPVEMTAEQYKEALYTDATGQKWMYLYKVKKS